MPHFIQVEDIFYLSPIFNWRNLLILDLYAFYKCCNLILFNFVDKMLNNYGNQIFLQTQEKY